MRLKFKFTRKRRIVEAGELEIDINELNEAEIKEKLYNLNFVSFLVTDIEPASNDEWDFRPVSIVTTDDRPTPKIARYLS